MSEANILNLVAGYQDACARASAGNSGSDFSELRHSVANTVNSLHPKRLMLRVAEIIDETPTTRSLRLISAAGSPAAVPGRTVSQCLR